MNELHSALAAAERRQADLEQRLVALVAASGTLFGSPKVEDVLPGVVLIARTLIPADGYALWRLDPATHVWRIGEASGVSPEFAVQVIASQQGDGLGTLPFSEPLAVESVRQLPLLDERLHVYRREGIESLLAVPLTIARRPTGTLVFYYRSRHAFDDVEINTARALANLAAAAITTAELFDEQRRSRDRAELANRRAAFLAEASAALASALDYEATLRTVASLAVPHVADWCAADIVDDRGEVQRLAVAHVDPARIELARSFRERYPDTADSPSSVARVLQTGAPVLVAELTDAMLVAGARDQEHLAALRQLGIRSFMIVPLVAHGRTLGALTFVHAESGRLYTDDDLRFAQDVAYRAALAVENARAYRHASAANRAKDEFLATLSHELRTPLNAVLGWTRMLRDGAVAADRMPRAFEVIERNATAQLGLVEDLLDLSRIITGKFRLEVGVVDLGAVIESAVEAVQPAASAKGITLTVSAEPGTETMAGDAARLQQAVWNLLSNAIKFTPDGGRVTVARRRSGGRVDIEVADTGEGIEAAVLPYVFDRFRQADSGTTRTHMGLGLGLAIVRHIVELHGGEATVTSAGKDSGATFTLSMPIVPAPPREAAALVGRARDVPARAADSFLHGVAVLVVEDDADARELIGEVLRSRGAVVTAVDSASGCLEELDRRTPDLILSDIAMPGFDGYELIRRVRARTPAQGGALPAVALTASARSDDAERSMAAGFQVHLPKPIDPDELVAVVARLTRRSA